MAMTSLTGMNPYGPAYSPYRPSVSYGPVNKGFPQTMPALGPLPKPPSQPVSFPPALPSMALSASPAPSALPGSGMMQPLGYYPIVRAYYQPVPVPVPVNVPTPSPLTQAAPAAPAPTPAPTPAESKAADPTAETSPTEPHAETPADSPVGETPTTSPGATGPLSREEEIGKAFGDLFTKTLQDNPELLAELEASRFNLDDPNAALEELRNFLAPVLRVMPDSMENTLFINRLDPTMQPVGRRFLNWVKRRPTNEGVTPSSVPGKSGTSSSSSASDSLDSTESTDPLGSDPLSDTDTGTDSTRSPHSTHRKPGRSHTSSSSSSSSASDLSDPFAEDTTEPVSEKRGWREKLNPFNRKKKEESDPFAESGTRSHGSSALDDLAL